MKNRSLFVALVFFSASVFADTWKPLNETQKVLKLQSHYGVIQHLEFNEKSFFNELNHSQYISLPLPEGGIEYFEIFEVAIMEPGLAAQFPQIRTFRGQSIDTEEVKRLVLDVTPKGLNATIYSTQGDVWIQPVSNDNSIEHISYYTKNYKALHSHKNHGWQCHTEDLMSTVNQKLAEEYQFRRGDNLPFNQSQLKTYRLAVAATGEYTQFHGGTVALGMSAIVTAMNRVNGIYESDMGFRMNLVANNDQIVFTDSVTDGYTNNDGAAMLSENQAILDNIIGDANYDIGHVFSTGGGGIAGLGVTCQSGSKGFGVTGLGSPIGDVFYVDYVAHELGHQWGANHTFNSISGFCAGNRFGPTAVEPGSASTIMGYAGICSSDNLQSNSDPYFNSASLEEMFSYTNSIGGSCAGSTVTNNLAPMIAAGDDHSIPHSTPFKLCATGSDSDSSSITYNWEQNDVGPAGSPNSPSDNAPIFRSFNSSDDNCRTFPKMSDILNQTSTFGEIMPSYARNLNFRVTARDNEPGGGALATDDLNLTVTSDGPFELTTHNSGSYSRNLPSIVQWNVANTDMAPINCSQVNISVSSDGGNNFIMDGGSPFSNSGTASILIPDVATASGRILVECADNVFFTVSTSNLSFVDDLIFSDGFEGI